MGGRGIVLGLIPSEPCMIHGHPFIGHSRVRRVPGVPCGECSDADEITLGIWTFVRVKVTWTIDLNEKGDGLGGHGESYLWVPEHVKAQNGYEGFSGKDR